MHNITPPNGFKDTLTWGRRHELSSLPVDALYSSVVKPKRKKVKKRPGLDVLKNLTAQEDVEAHTATPPGEEVEEKPGTTKEVQEVEVLEVKSNSKNEFLKLDPKKEGDAKVTPEEASEDVLAKSSVTSGNEPVRKEEGTRVVEVRTESEVEKATKELRNAVGKIGRSRRQNDAVEPAAEVEKVTAEVTVAEDKAAKSGCRADKKTKERPARKPKPAIKPESTDKESPMSPEALAKAEIGKAVDSKQSFKEENAELSSETRGGKNEASVTDESKIKKSEPHKEAVIKSKKITAENHESSEKRSKSPQNKIKSDTNERAKKSDGSQGTLRRKKGKAKHAPNVKSPEETASSPSGDSCPPESNLKPTSVNKKKQNKNSRPDPKEKMKGSKAPAKSDRPKAEDCDAASRPPIIPILKKVVNEKQTPSQERYLKRQISHSPLETIDQSDEKSKANKLITPPEVPANKTENNDQVGKTPQNSTCEPKEKFNTEIKFCEKDETSKTSELDDTSRLVSEKETDQTKLTSFSENLQQNTPIAIEISDDGTWGSADPNSTSEKAETESSEKCEELKSSDFLNANLSAEDIKMQHVLSEYGNSYFIQTANKPVEKKSSKPAGANNHVGNKGKVQSSAPAQRCSLRDELKRFVRESEMAAQRALEAEKELPKEQQPERIVESEVTPQEIHKLESGTETEDAEILAKGRKGVLEKTMVRAKKRDSWIKGEDVTLSTDKERRIDDWLSTGAQQLSLPAKLPEEIYDLAMDPNISLLITKEGELSFL
ncbi:uncharacterized protein [Bemisia tabaci]|uniref:uncharacterized protein n=1 Tax=Bemisia tabaci TaxID=7038 RepID=UPI003B27C3AD